jgi:hypothetical protein
VLLGAWPARAAVPGEVAAAVDLFAEPASAAPVVVVTPAVRGRVDPLPWLGVRADWTSDVVTGATPRTYGTPDAVSAATPFSEVRNSLGAQVEARLRERARIYTGYRFGIENDYRSHVIQAGARVDLWQHDTVLALDWAHNFDSVCDLDNRGLAVTARQPLVSSLGCFAGQAGLTSEPLGIDAAQLSLTQVLTPRLEFQLVGSFEHADGFQSNPYRRVRLWGGTVEAQESHPRLRDRGALTARLRYALGRAGALGVDGRIYRDSWGILAVSGEASWDQLLAAGRWRVRVRARGYGQSRALFYRDAGEADSYERAGPPGQYFTGDREMAPLADVVIGGALWYRTGAAGRRVARVLERLEVGARADVMKVFALSPEPPDAARTRGVIDALTLGLHALGAF